MKISTRKFEHILIHSWEISETPIVPVKLLSFKMADPRFKITWSANNKTILTTPEKGQ